MRDLIVSLFIVGSLPTCFRRPFIGLLMFTVLAYMRIQDLTWGFARYQRWSFYVALITFAGFLLSKDPNKRFMVPDIRCWIMVLLGLLVGASILFSDSPSLKDIDDYVEFCKIIGIALFTTGVLRNREYMRILIWVIALSFGFYGVKNGVAMIVSGGSLQINHGPGGMLADNNDFALALCMGIPLLLHLGFAERRPLLRRVMIGIVPLMVLTIAATYSRGAFLAMCACGAVLIWRSRNRLAGFTLCALILVAGAIAAPKQYVERLSTIRTYNTESSAQGRLDAWRVAGHMVAAKPLLGVGFQKFQENYARYDPMRGAGFGVRVTHNSYLQIWAECGTPALILYLSLIVLTLIDLWRIRALAAARYHSSWIISYATMFEASLVAFIVGSFFLNRAQFDLFYHFVAIVVVFGRIARQALSDEHLHPLRTGERGPLVLARDRAFGARPVPAGFGAGKTAPQGPRRPAFGS